MKKQLVSKYTRSLLLLIILTGLLSVMPSCGGGGGGGGGGEPTGPPWISAGLISLPTGSSLPGYESAWVEVWDDNTGYPITNAIVTINGVALAYRSADEDYEGDVIVAPGQSVVLNVTVGGKTYTVSGTQLTSYPTIVQPASGASWAASLPHTVKWSGAALALGILDADDPSGELLWPLDGYMKIVSPNDTSCTIPENNLTPGNRLVIIGMWQYINIMDAAPGSYMAIGGLNYAPFTVTNASLVSIAVTPVNPSIAWGTKQQFTAIGTFSDNSTQDLTGQVQWGSDNNTAAYMDSTIPGLAWIQYTGTATISASFAGVTGSTSLTVVSLVSISVTPINPSIGWGTSQQFTAIGTLSDNSTQDLTGQVQWWTDTFAAYMDSTIPGMARAQFAGTVTISASLAGVTGSTSLTVLPAKLLSIEVSPSNRTIAPGTIQHVSAAGLYEDGLRDMTSSVTWNSSNPDVATISNVSGHNGEATAVASGTSTINATSSGITGTAALTVAAWPSMSENYVLLQSDAGDYIGDGKTYTYTQTNTQFTVSATGGHLSVSVSGGGDWWQGDFVVPNSPSQLQTGYYDNLTRYLNDPSVGSLAWFGNGRGCNELTGSFTIDSVTYNSGNLAAIDLRFEQHCEWSGTPALYGWIHWAQ